MLNGLSQLVYSRDDLEIIAVDNASTDSTKEIILSYQGALPISYLYCAERGKNIALNSAIGQITGDLVVFTDDDTICEPSWISTYACSALEHSEYDIFGGTILPHWESLPLPWLIENLPIGITYALTDPELQSGEIFPGLIWGPNMMVRRRVFDAGLRFNESVGPSAGQYAMGSETEFNIRAASMNHRCYFEPRAVVSHIIRPNQVHPEWVLGRAFRYGRNVWNEERLEGGQSDVPLVFGVPRWRVRRYLEHRVLAGLRRLTGGPEDAFRHDWEVMFLRGYFEQARKDRT